MEKRARGRPKAYDREAALQSALETFHTKGYAATSLDDLAAAMGMNRSSLYNAFGNKESLYHQTLAHFTDQLRTISNAPLFAEPELKKALEGFYMAALDVYLRDEPPLGCFMFCTAPAEAVTHPDIAGDMRQMLVEIDRALERRFAQAQQDGEFPSEADCHDVAKLAQAVLHSLALRARAGESRRSLNRMVKSAIGLLCAGV
jgi:AcrR family transcriptional regulator